MTAPERSAERDAAVRAVLPLVPEEGWTIAALRRAAGPDADLLFPGGATDLVETFVDLADREMEADAAAFDTTGLGLTRRVRLVIALRLRQQEPNREAIRRALGVLALPGRGVLAARTLGRTVDAVWRAAGDESAGLARYTKRATLAGVYSATLLFWLRDTGEGAADTLAFLDRRLADVGRIGRLRAGLGRRRPG